MNSLRFAVQRVVATLSGMLSRRPVPCLLLASLLVHGMAAIAVTLRTGRLDTFAFDSLDCEEYYHIARNVAERGIFSDYSAPPFIPDTWRTPGYPALLAGGILLVGTSPVALIIVQQIIAAIGVIVLFRVSRAHMSDRRAAVVSGLFLLAPYRVFYSFWLLSTSWFTTLLLVLWQTVEQARRDARWTRYALAGLLNGLLVLIWPGAILIPFVTLALMLFEFPYQDLNRTRATIPAPRAPTNDDHPGRGNRKRRSWRGIAAFLLCCAIVVTAWMIRNLSVAGHFALSHQGGIVLAYFKATEVELWRQGRTADRYIETSLSPSSAQLPHMVWDEIDAELRTRLSGKTTSESASVQWSNLAQGNRTELDSFEISRELMRIAWGYLWRSPWTTLACCLTRIGENLIFPLNLLIETPAGVVVSRLQSAALGTFYALAASAAIVGVVRSRRQWPAILFPVGCLVALTLTTTPQIDPRFRVPMLPLMLFIALLRRRSGKNEVRDSTI